MATAQLIVNIAADISEIVSGVNSVKKHLESLGMKVKQTNTTMKDVQKSTKGMFDEMTKGWVGIAAKLNTLDYTLRILKNTFMATFGAGFKAVNEFKLGTASAAAVVAQFMELKPGETIAEGFQRATAYAEDMYPVLEKIAAKTLLSGRETQLMFQEFAKGGVLLDATNKKAVEGFSAMGNAIAIMTQGQDRERQILTEIKAVMEGQNRAGAIMVRMLEAQNPRIKEQLKLWKEEGTVLEHMAELLKGFDLASGKLELTLEAVITRLQTSVKQIARGAFSDAFDRVLKIIIQIDDYLQSNRDIITKDISQALAALEGIFTSIFKLIIGILEGLQIMLGTTQSLVFEWHNMQLVMKKVNDENEKQRSSLRTLVEGWAFLGAVILPGIADLVRNIASAIFNAGAAVNALTDAWAFGITFQAEKAKKSLDEMAEYAKKAWKNTFPGVGIFDEYAEKFAKMKAMVGWDNLIGKSATPPKTKKMADDVASDMKKIQDAYAKMVTSLERKIDTEGLEGWRKELVDMKYELDELLSSANLTTAQKYKLIQLKLELIGKQKAIQDMKEAEAQAEKTARALDKIRQHWARVAETQMELAEATLALKIAQEDLTKSETIELYIDATEQLIVKQEELIDALGETARGNAEWNHQMAILLGYQTDLANFNQQLKEIRGTFAEGFSKGIREASEELSNMYETGQRVAQDLKNAFQNFFEDAFSGGKDAWKNLMDSMKSMFIKLLAQLATEALLKQITITINVKTDESSNAGAAAGAGALEGFKTAGIAYAATLWIDTITKSIEEQDWGRAIAYTTTGLVGGKIYDLVNDLFDDVETPKMGLKYRAEEGTWGFPSKEGWSASQEVKDNLRNVFDTVRNTLIDVTNEFGGDITKFYDDWQSDIRDVKKLKDRVGIILWEYTKEMTGIDLKKFRKEGEEMAETFDRIIGALYGFKNLNESIDILIRGLEGSLEMIDYWNLALGEAEENIRQLKTSLSDAIDPTDIVELGNQLMRAIYDRYDAEIQFVSSLEQKINDLKDVLADLSLNRAQTMIRLSNLGGGVNLGSVVNTLKTTFFDLYAKVTGEGTGTQKLGWLEQMTQVVEAWIDASEQVIRNQYEPQIEINEQAIDILSKQLTVLRAWEDLNNTVKKMLDNIMLTTANPRDVYERMGLAQAEVQRLQGAYSGATGETKANIGKELTGAIQTYLNLAQEGYQRPSMEYQAIWSDMVSLLNMLQSDSAVYAGQAEDIQTRIADLQEENVRLQTLMQADLANLKPDIDGAAQWLASAFETAYAVRSYEIVSEISQLETTLHAVIGDKTVGAYIEDLRDKAILELTAIKGILKAQWGATGLPTAEPISTPTPAGSKYVPFNPKNPTREGYASMDISKQILSAAEAWSKTKYGNPADYQQLLAAFQQNSNMLPLSWAEPWAKGLGIPLYQSGTDYVPKTGLAYLHQGEKVIPAGGGGDIYFNLSPTINASGDASPKEIWRELEDYAIQSVKGGRLGKILQGVKRG